MNLPSASHMGGAWKRQIRTVRSVLTAILDQSSRRLDSLSLRMYEVMAIINSRPLTAHLLNDPAGPQPLKPNHILTMKSSIIFPECSNDKSPPGVSKGPLQLYELNGRRSCAMLPCSLCCSVKHHIVETLDSVGITT